MDNLSDIKDKLAALDAHIAEKTKELAKQGVLHGAARVKATELRIQRVRLARLAEERAKGSKHPEAIATLAAEAEAIRLLFSRLIAEIDKGD
jgi:hypothetical protein